MAVLREYKFETKKIFHISHVILFRFSWKTTHGNSSFQCGRNLRLTADFGGGCFPSSSSALFAVRFSAVLLRDWSVELSIPFSSGAPGEDLKKDRILPCFEPERLASLLVVETGTCSGA